MASTSETGHSKNLANFKTLISFCTGYGSRYNPPRELLTLAGLNKAYLTGDKVLLNVKTTKTDFDNHVNARAVGFGEVPGFSTQLVRFFSSCEVSPEALSDARGYLRKIQGRRAKPIRPDSKPAAEPSEAKEERHISVSQLSFDSLLDNFKKLVLTVISQPGYKANEAQFTPEGLQEKIDELTRLNDNVINSFTAWSNARIERDNVFYNSVTGLKKILQDVKNYVAGIFLMNSPQYKQLSGLTFKNLKK